MSQTHDLAISIIRKTRSHIDNTCDRYGKLMRTGFVTHPIPYFGRLSNAKVVTLGLNPSSKEFTKKRNWPPSISSDDLHDRLSGYFDSVAPPPHKFFESWSGALTHINASYNHDAVHLDLSPRATRHCGRRHSSHRPPEPTLSQRVRKTNTRWPSRTAII